MKNLNKPTLINFISLGIILILLYILIFRKPDLPIEKFDETSLRNEIEVQKNLVKSWEKIANSAVKNADKHIARADSLEKLKPQVKHYYHEIYTFNSNANTSQLDSVIRSNW